MPSVRYLTVALTAGLFVADVSFADNLKVPIGSRIARPVDETTVLQGSGLAGAVGTDLDPFKSTRNVRSKSERVSIAGLSPALIRPVAALQRALERGAVAEAGKLLASVEQAAATPVDRYVAAQYRFRLANAAGDEPGADRAIEAMIATGAVPQAELDLAYRRLFSRAFNGGDLARAERLAAAHLDAMPGDPAALYNLSAVHLRRGRHRDAALQLDRAIAALGARGKPAPPYWTDLSRQLAAMRP